MTKSTITRERLQEIAEGQSGFNLRTATHEESQELARMALAAMDSEPVGEVIERPCSGEMNTGMTYRRVKGLGEMESMPVGTKFYVAQPSPVVPDELNTRTANDVMNEHLSWKDYGDAEVFCIAWNACRAAMLATAPQEVKS